HAPGAAERDSHAGDDVGGRRWQDDTSQQGNALRPITARGIDQNRVDVAGASLGIEIEREELGNEHYEDNGRVAKPEPEDRKRYPSDSWNRIERPDDRVDEFAHRAE